MLIASPARKCSPELRVDRGADERLAGVDADPSRSGPPRAWQLRGVLGDPERCPDGALGVVLVGRRDAEHAHHGVADELLDDPAVRSIWAGPSRSSAEHPVDVLRIGAFRRRGEPDEVAEQRRDDLALLGSGACAGRRRAPHALQNLAPSAFSVAQIGQIGIWPTA